MSDTLRASAQQAPEALENERYVSQYTHIVDAITALQAALAEPDVPEACFGNMARAEAVAAERERCAQVCRARAEKMHAEAERLRTTEPDEVSALLATAWQLTLAAQEITELKDTK